MAITAVSGQFVATSGTSATAITGTLPSAPTQGNLLVAMVDCAGLVTPTATGSWNKLTQIQSTDTGALFWKIVPASDTALQTLTSANTGSSWGVVIQEFTGQIASPLLVQNNQSSTTTSKASPSVSPTTGLEALVVGGAFSDGTRTWSSSAFTGSNVGTVTNVGTGSRGAANTGESATLWYAAITSTTGSYSATITCSAADGGGAAVAVFRATPTRSVAGAQPAPSGTLSQVQTRFRSLSGAQPVLVAVQYADPTTTYADLNTYYTGRSPGILEAEEAAGINRSVAGSQPAATGTLTRVQTFLRSVAGSQPAATGTLTRILGALRAVDGSQPAAVGTLTRLLAAVRSLAGDQPAATGTLTRVLGALRTLAGDQPTATGTLEATTAPATTATVALDAIGSLAAAGAHAGTGTAAVAAAGPIAATGTKASSAAVAIVALARGAASTEEAGEATVSLAGTGLLSSVGARASTATVTITAAGALVSAGTRAATGAVTERATATLEATGTKASAATAAGSLLGLLSSAGSKVASAVVSLAGLVRSATAGAHAGTTTATLTATGPTTTADSTTRMATASLVGTAKLSAVSIPTFEQPATLAGMPRFSVTAEKGAVTAPTIRAVGHLADQSARQQLGTAELRAVGSAQIAGTHAGTTPSVELSAALSSELVTATARTDAAAAFGTAYVLLLVALQQAPGTVAVGTVSLGGVLAGSVTVGSLSAGATMDGGVLAGSYRVDAVASGAIPIGGDVRAGTAP